MKTASAIAAMVLVAAGLTACGNSGSAGGQAAATQPAEKKGEVVATVGTDVITVDEFKAKMDEQSPFIRARYNNLERKKEFLDNMVRFEVLAQEAQRRGLQNDPEVQATMKKVMVQKLMRAEFDESQAADQVPEADLKKFYDDNIADYVKPERVRVSHIFLAAAKGDASRAKVKTEAMKLLNDVKAKESGPVKTAFAESAKVRSDDVATKAAGGDLLFKTREELAQAWGEDFAKAVFDIKGIGEIGGVVETEKGIHLVKLTGRQNALERPFDQVKGQIANRLFREKRTKAFEDFVGQLKQKANVQVKDDVLAKIDVAGSPAVEANPLGGALPTHPGMVQPAAGTQPGGMAPVKVPADPAAAPGSNQQIQLKGPGGKQLSIPTRALQATPPTVKVEQK